MKILVRRPVLVVLIACAALPAVACGGGGNSPTAPSASAGSSSTTTGSGGGTITPSGAPVAYVQDVKPVLDTDCVRCHGSSRRDGGVDLSTYANVLRTATAGNANSALVRTTRSSGSMYGYLSGDRAAKSELIRAWVVDNAVAESR
jgi:hypothetical protein